MTLRLPTILMLLAIVVAACGQPEPDPIATATATPTPDSGSAAVPTISTGVRPLSDILVSEPHFTNLQPRSVTVLVDTTIPVVCAAAYGTSESYGQLATDSDMAASGHRDHHPLLTNLEPDTEYHIRLQGIGPDGTLYQSQDYTVRTPPAQADEPQRPSGENLALFSNGARIAGVSSNFGGGGNDTTYGANMAIDGRLDTEWSSNGDGDAAWIDIQLADVAHITTIGFRTRTMGTSAQIITFRVTADGRTVGSFTLDDATSVHYFETDTTAQRLRFEAVETSGGNTGAVEIEIYGNLEMDMMDM